MTPGPIHVIDCPGCGQLHRALSLASGNAFGAYSWTDGRIVAHMSPEFPRCTRCLRCGAFFWVPRAREVGSYDEMAAFYDDRRFDVRLEEVGPRRLEVMKLLREKTGWGLVEAKARLRQLPLLLGESLHTGLAKELARDYAEVGAKAELRLSAVQPPEEERIPPPPPEWVQAPVVPDLSEAQLLQALAEAVAQTREDEQYLRLRAWWAGNEPFRASTAGWLPFPARSEAARANLEKLLGLLDEQDPLEQLMKAEALRELERFPEAEALLARPSDARRQRALGFIRELARLRIAAVKQFPDSTWKD